MRGIRTGISFAARVCALAALLSLPSARPAPAGTAAGGPAVHLTAAEREWLKTHPVIRVVQTPDWNPVEFEDEAGRPRGISEDYLRLIEGRLGIKFKRITGLPWDKAYPRLQRGEIDMTTSVVDTPARRKFWAFTEPYINIPIVIVTRRKVVYVAGLEGLSGRKVAVGKGYAVTEFIPKDFPGIELIEVLSVREGLEAVRSGKAYAFLDNMLVAGYYLSHMKIGDLKISGYTRYVNAQRMAVRKDWAPLAGILQKALASVSPEESNEIYDRWVPLPYEDWMDLGFFLRVIGVLAAALLVFGFWNWTLSREVSARKKAEREMAAANRDLEEKKLELQNFLNITTHDLRSPLVNVGFFAGDLKKALAEMEDSLDGVPLPPKAKSKLAEVMGERAPKALGFISEGAGQMSRMTDALLKVARLGRVPLSPSRLDMDAVLAKVIGELRPLIERAGASVVAEPLPRCVADRDSAGYVLANLLDNALKYRSPDRPLRIRVSGSSANGRAIYSVSDNGMGVPEEKRARIGQAFYRAHPGRAAGEGMGLAMIKRVLELNGGRLRLEPGADGGSVFSFELPSGA